MGNMLDSYPNLNSQDIYEKFEKRYQEEYNRIAKTLLKTPFTEWTKRYVKSPLFEFSVITLISTLVVFCIFGDPNLGFFIFTGLVFIIFSMTHYSTTFSNNEKTMADSVIKKIFEDEEIELSNFSIRKLIDSSAESGSDIIRLINVLKHEKIYLSFKGIIMGLFGIFIGLISSKIYESDIDQAMNDFRQLIFLAVVFFLCLLCFYMIYYYFHMLIYRRKNLYIQVLTDIELTIELRKNKKEYKDK